jgi:hypothetical protein
VDDQTLLTAVDNAILSLLNGGAVQAWTEGGHQVQHMKLPELYALKQQLETRIAQATYPMAVPVVSRDI